MRIEIFVVFRVWLILSFVFLSSFMQVRAQQTAQQHVNLQRGVNNESNNSDTFDNVNLHNGNLSLAIPIGQRFNAGGNLNYGLTLIYNSNVWDFNEKNDPRANGNRGGIVNQAIPDPKSNAGLGWKLSLGSLY